MNNFFDIAVIGAGPSGLCLAKSMSKLGLSVAVIEKQSRNKTEEPGEDGRDIALTHFSKNMLEDLDMWQYIPEDEVSFIKEARVFNGNSSHYMRLASSESERLAFIVSNRHIRAAAYAAIKDDGNITLLENVSPERIELKDCAAELTLSDGKIIVCKLLVAADSRFSETRRKVGISASSYDFGKTMIVCRTENERDHEYIACECFRHGYTLAVLPLNKKRTSVVITVTPEKADEIMRMSPAELSAWAGKQFQYGLGEMRLEGERFAYPLVGVYAERFTARRFALVGDAAVGMHPVTAHGFNFGLKSIDTLSKSVGAALYIGGDIASEAVLTLYEQKHKRDTKPLYLATQSIVKLYTDDAFPAKIARKLLLRAADNMLPVKSLLMAKLTETESKNRGLPLPPSPLSVAQKLLKVAG